MKNPRRPFFGNATLSLCGDPAVTLGDRSWMPDETTAYLRFCLSFAFPNVSSYGDGIHAGVIARTINPIDSKPAGFVSLDHKPVNSNHSMVAYGSDADAVLGTVVGVDYPAMPAGGWKTAPDRKGASYITGVAALWLTAAGTAKWIARYEDKRKPVAVSMEVLYSTAASGFALSRNGDERTELAVTPDEFWEAGWEYVPMSKLLTPDQAGLDAEGIAECATRAPRGSLLRARNFKTRRMNGGSLLGSGLVGSWNGRDVYFMQGGIESTASVHYPGMGLVEYGAEPRAGIQTMLAEDEGLLEIETGLAEVSAAVTGAFEELTGK